MIIKRSAELKPELTPRAYLPGSISHMIFRPDACRGHGNADWVRIWIPKLKALKRVIGIKMLGIVINDGTIRKSKNQINATIAGAIKIPACI